MRQRPRRERTPGSVRGRCFTEGGRLRTSLTAISAKRTVPLLSGRRVGWRPRLASRLRRTDALVQEGKMTGPVAAPRGKGSAWAAGEGKNANECRRVSDLVCRDDRGPVSLRGRGCIVARRPLRGGVTSWPIHGLFCSASNLPPVTIPPMTSSFSIAASSFGGARRTDGSGVSVRWSGCSPITRSRSGAICASPTSPRNQDLVIHTCRTFMLDGKEVQALPRAFNRTTPERVALCPDRTDLQETVISFLGVERGSRSSSTTPSATGTPGVRGSEGIEPIGATAPGS